VSYQAVTWALQQPVRHSPAKFVLVALAHFHQAPRGEKAGPMHAWASTTTLVNATGQDRKTVLANIQRLLEAGFLVDTGKREGQTKSVVIYALSEPSSSTESGTASEAGSSPKFPPKAVPNAGPLIEPEAVPVSTAKQSQFSPEAVPVFPTEKVEKEKIEKKNIKHIARRARAKHPLPDNFGISERVAKWAQEKGHTNLSAHLDHFIGCAKARGYTYADWDQALMNAIRENWARLGQPRMASGTPSRLSIAEQRQQEFLRLMGNDDGRTVDMEAA